MTPAQLENLKLVTRRRFFQQCGTGMGALALASLFNEKLFAAPAAPAATPIVPLGPHFKPKAKNIIYLFQSGGPSHLDLFDYKPELVKRNGQAMPEEMLKNIRLAQIGKNAKVLGTNYQFKQYGKSGVWLSELLPHLSTIVDDVAFVQGFYSEAFNHDPATLFMNTGAQLSGRPSMGAWFSYGLGSENKDLPAFVVLTTGVGQPLTNNAWGSGFLPTVHQGVQLRSQGDPVLYVSNPAGMGAKQRRESLDALRDLNQMRYDALRDPEIATRISAYELAYRMQTSVPDVMDISKEPAAMHEAYGTTPGRASFANNCLLARRLVERGVRFVQLFNGAYAMGEGVGNWDGHKTLKQQYDIHAPILDQPCAALLKDMKSRGLMEHTLVVWVTEFGRMPTFQKGANGRDHNPNGFTVWLTGAGVKRGFSYGATDEFGYKAVENVTTIYDLHATILHLLGLDHERLSYYHNGIERRLTDVHGKVVTDVLS